MDEGTDHIACLYRSYTVHEKFGFKGNDHKLEPESFGSNNGENIF